MDQLVSSETVIKKNIILVSDLMNIELEKVTEEEWILEKLIEQYKLDEKENASRHIEEIDPDPQLLVKPLMP